MSDLLHTLNPKNIPQHVAIIMDGNGRWAKMKGNSRIFGHQSAIEAVRDTTEGAVASGIKYLTLYAFSTENWKRPKFEVNALMELLVMTIRKETPTLQKNNVQLKAIGNISELPSGCQDQLQEAMSITQDNTGMVLNLALSYGGRWDILAATRKLMEDAIKGLISPNDLTEKIFSDCLSTKFLPDPELMIRTSGEFRVSNFLLWEIAYAEIHITQKLWPDFRRNDLYLAIQDYQKRERRFGKTSEQINPA
ncbi:MAG: isoprenyl transferase [Sphingobacteriia bacterium]|nr:isoprenyl transferase [Sphingobacteriia bacterium]